MGTAVAEPNQTEPTTEQAVLGALLILMLSGLPPAVITAQALPLLASLGITPRAGISALALVLPHAEAPEIPAGPAVAATTQTEMVRRVEYLVNAARRLDAPEHEFARERRHLEQHLAATRARSAAAAKVDRAAQRYGPVLGWHAILDGRTTLECRAAHGANFHVGVPPAIGYPGTPHGGTCRCSAGPPHKTLLTVDEATSAIAQAEVIPFRVELSHGYDPDRIGRRRRFRGGR